MVKTKAAAVAPARKPATAKAASTTVQSAAKSTNSPIAKKAAAPATAVKKPLPASQRAETGGSSTASRLVSKLKPAKVLKPAKGKKIKLVRDSFTMPKAEYRLISLLKDRCLTAGVAAKKSEILRAALASLSELSDAAVLAAVRRLQVIKTGRPKGRNSRSRIQLGAGIAPSRPTTPLPSPTGGAEIRKSDRAAQPPPALQPDQR